MYRERERCIPTCVHMYMYIYIYIYRERERVMRNEPTHELTATHNI